MLGRLAMNEQPVYDISAHDPIALGVAALSAILSVAVASAIPIWRAIRTDPIATLHEV
jgi:ABC-type lipoprotein release transport system permease subunit